MKINFVPKTGLGKWSIGFIAIAPILFYIVYIGMSLVGFYESVPAGKTILHDVAARPWLALSMLGGFFSGIAAFLFGVIGILKKKDYSVLVFIPTLLGLFVLLLTLAEVSFPH